MLVLASTLAGALEELPYTFADLPLRDFERKPEASQAAVFLLRRPGQQAGECLAFAGMDALVGAAPCKITDGQLWSYRSQQLVLAHDTSLCLDEFGPHAGNDLGVYWCHGQACLLQPAPLAARSPPLPNGPSSPARARARVIAAAAPFCPRRALRRRRQPALRATRRHAAQLLLANCAASALHRESGAARRGAPLRQRHGGAVAAQAAQAAQAAVRVRLGRGRGALRGVGGARRVRLQHALHAAALRAQLRARRGRRRPQRRVRPGCGGRCRRSTCDAARGAGAGLGHWCRRRAAKAANRVVSGNIHDFATAEEAALQVARATEAGVSLTDADGLLSRDRRGSSSEPWQQQQQQGPQ